MLSIIIGWAAFPSYLVQDWRLSPVSRRRGKNEVGPPPDSPECQKGELDLCIQNNRSIHQSMTEGRKNMPKRGFAQPTKWWARSDRKGLCVARPRLRHGLELVFAMHLAKAHGHATPFSRHHTGDSEGLPAPWIPLEKDRKDKGQCLKPASGWQPSSAPRKADIRCALQNTHTPTTRRDQQSLSFA